MDIKEHYENHLAKYYSWMFGSFESKISENLALFKRLGITPKLNQIAIDLGAGSGFQSIPLANLGFKVKAIDFSKTLLQELRDRAKNLDIQLYENDILDFPIYANLNPELVICMGDTLTHLPSTDSVMNLIINSYKILDTGGKLILSYRDLSFELKDSERFIPAKLTDDTIFTCFLEYFEDYVKVFDVVHEKHEQEWKQKVSFYKKLKLPKIKVENMLAEAGFTISAVEVEKGFVIIVAEK